MFDNTPESYDKQFLAEPNRWATRQDVDDHIKDIIDKIPGTLKVLDLGCGQGRTIEIIKNDKLSITGLDFSMEALKIARAANPNIRFLHEDMRHTSLEDKSFDIVLSVGSHEHLQQIDFSEPFRLLTDVGIFLAVFPISGNDRGWIESRPQSEWKLTRATWINQLVRFGFIADKQVLHKNLIICRKKHD